MVLKATCTFQGILHFSLFKLKCYQLSNGTLEYTRNPPGGRKVWPIISFRQWISWTYPTHSSPPLTRNWTVLLNKQTNPLPNQLEKGRLFFKKPPPRENFMPQEPELKSTLLCFWAMAESFCLTVLSRLVLCIPKWYVNTWSHMCMAVPMCTIQYKHVAENLSPLCFLAAARLSRTPPKKRKTKKLEAWPDTSHLSQKKIILFR